MSSLIALHKIEGYIQTIYLAEYADSLLLLDGCSRPDVPKVLAFIEHELARKKEDLKLVVVTHMHPDHVGGVQHFRKLTGCQVASADISGQWYQGLAGGVMHLTDIGLAHFVASRQKKPFERLWYPRKLQPDILLKEGEKIPGFEDWVAYFTPGHTDRDLSLLHEPTRTVYVADLIVKIRDKYVPPVPISYPNRYKRSLEKIRNLEKDYFILAHGGENRAEEVDLDLLIQRSPDEPLTQWKVIWKNIHQRLLFNMFKQKNRR